MMKAARQVSIAARRSTSTSHFLLRLPSAMILRWLLNVPGPHHGIVTDEARRNLRKKRLKNLGQRSVQHFGGNAPGKNAE
jgi:hypothetical protein